MATYNSVTFYFLAIVLSLFLHNTAAKNPLALFACEYGKYREKCYETLNNTLSLTKNGTFCKGEFDNYICWPHTEGESLANAPCPTFVVSSKPETGFAYRFCRGDGTWFKTDSNESWIFRGNCNLYQQSKEIEKPTDVKVLNTVSIIYTIGYAVSVTCLVIALIILCFFKKLHCTRNYIHINLMLSFIFRYVAIFIKDKVVNDFYQPEKWLKEEKILDINCEEFASGDILVRCRLAIVFMHYALTSNYFWIFVEGIHLQLILIFPMNNTRSNRYFSFYMAFGWGVSWIPIVIWVALMLTHDNLGCWETNDDLQLWWVMWSPVVATIVINFIIFVNVIRMIVSKLRANNIEKTDYKYRLAKSTLTLIPLLNIHYIIFIIIYEGVVDTNSTLMYVKISFELILTSIQGTFIALFYCFLNSEVRGELQKIWKKWRDKNSMNKSKPQRANSTHLSHATHVTSLLSSTHAEEKV